MAIWQWHTWIVPRKEVLKHFTQLPEYLDQGWFESVKWWASISELDLIYIFDNLLQRYETPWAKNTISWGENDGDRVHLTIEEGLVIDVLISIDLRNLNIDFLDLLMKFSEEKDFVLYSLELNKFFEPNMPSLLSELQNSRKMNFVSNPKKFFDDKSYFDRIEKENIKKIINNIDLKKNT